MENSIFERHKANFSAKFDSLQAMVERIDKSLRELDLIMDALQPQGISGKLRVAFVQGDGQEVPELRILRRKRSGEGWFSKRVRKGWGSRSLKRTGVFETNYEIVKVVCKTIESLIAERAKLMIRLRSLSTGFNEAVRTAEVRLDNLHENYVNPFVQTYALNSEKTSE